MLNLGERRNFLTLIGRDGESVTVRCDCGKTKKIFRAHWGQTKSCGCKTHEILSKARTRHGYSVKGKNGTIKWRTWIAWESMHWRCYNKNRRDYPRYGGRGIMVCGRWHKFENFLADMGQAPPGLSLGRIDNDKSYSPGNCKWQDAIEQANNRSTNKTLRAFGKSMTLKQWSRLINVMDDTIRNRLKNGWSVERALSSSLRRMTNNRRPNLPHCQGCAKGELFGAHQAGTLEHPPV